MQHNLVGGMLGEPDENEAAVMEAIGSLFDAAHYLSIYEDVAKEGINPLLHYVRYGFREGRRPNSSFCAIEYAAHNPEVLKNNLNPLLHFVLSQKSSSDDISKKELLLDLAGGDLHSIAYTRESDREDQIEKSNISSDSIENHDLDEISLLISSEFDKEYYIESNNDVKHSGVNALKHFSNTGWKELRNPNNEFNTSYYLQSNPDVAQAGVNPFWHYLVAGRKEGRLPSHPGGWKAKVLETLPTLDEQKRAWAKPSAPSNKLSYAKLKTEILAKCSNFSWNILISLSHDDYRSNAGGVQLCLQLEAETAMHDEYVYMNIFPYQPLPTMSGVEATDEFYTGIILNNQFIGFTSFAFLLRLIGEVNKVGANFYVVIHSLLGHNANLILDLFQAARKTTGILWAHDYTLLCSNHALQRNSISFCGAPKLASVACNICYHGKERATHLASISKLFSHLNLKVIAPSENTRDFLREKSLIPLSDISIIPHMTIEFKPALSPEPQIKGPIKVGYLGYKAAHKGWPVFRELARKWHREGLYQFHYFGVDQQSEVGIENHYVHASSEDPLSMVKALKSAAVDLVLHWSSARETFSFSTFESLAAGCYIITSATSGNVAAAVDNFGRGKVLEDQDEVNECFRSGDAVKLARSSRALRSSEKCLVNYSRFSLTYLEEEKSK